MTLKTALTPLVASLALAACIEKGIVPAQFDAFHDKAEAGDAFAQAQLGQHYLVGPEGVKDLKLATYWLERAAEQNEAQAIYILGAMRERGRGFAKDMRAAHTFYMRAAMLNNGPAQEALARIYAKGLIGPVDNVTSHKWQILSDNHGWSFRPTDYKARNALTAEQIKLAKAGAAKVSVQF